MWKIANSLLFSPWSLTKPKAFYKIQVIARLWLEYLKLVIRLLTTNRAWFGMSVSFMFSGGGGL